MKKVILIVLVLVLVTSCITFAGCDPYNWEIRSAYQRVERKLINELQDDLPYSLRNRKINHLIFGDVDEEGNLRVDIYYAGETELGNDFNVLAVYKLAVQYYNALVEADNSGDILKYLEVLDACFENMEYIREDRSYLSNDLGLDDKEVKQFNEFYLSEWGEDQVGFLPYFIKEVNAEAINEGNYNLEYTFIVKGFNFVKNPNGAFKLPNYSELISTVKYPISSVDVYDQDIEITFKFDKSKFIPDSNKAFSILIRRHFIGKDMSVTFNTVSSKKPDVTEKFIKMTMGQFDFKQPANAQ